MLLGGLWQSFGDVGRDRALADHGGCDRLAAIGVALQRRVEDEPGEENRQSAGEAAPEPARIGPRRARALRLPERLVKFAERQSGQEAPSSSTSIHLRISSQR